MNLIKITKTLGIAILSMISLSSAAQDLIARQAPSDKHLKDVRNVRINGRSLSASSADLSNPASDIYSDWRNAGVTSVAGHVPANYKIDLTGFCMPTSSRKVTSNFGPRWGRAHQGIDVKVYIGDTIRAAFDGKVRVTQYQGGGYGYHVVIRHPNGLETLYGHLSKIIAKENQIVKAGDVIGLGGNTGRSTGSHLHFETRLCGTAINPALMFDFENQDVVANSFVYRGGTIRKDTSIANNTKKAEAENEKRNEEIAAADTQNTEEAIELQEETAKSSRKSRQAKKKQSKKPTAYSVQDGDNLSKIAKAHGTTVEKLCKLNGINRDGILRKGQKIKTS